MDTDRDYHHPYKPYAIQQQFMNTVYDCLEQGKVGILESPTGTGKSLSLICSSLTWLRDHKRKAAECSAEEPDKDGQEPDWLLDYARKQSRLAVQQHDADLNARLATIRAKEARARARYESAQPPLKRQKQDNDASGKEDDAVFALDDYESDDQSNDSKGLPAQGGISAETQTLLDRVGGSLPDRAKEDGESDQIDETKVFFCSRTHSQLTQFTSELNKVKIPPSFEEELLHDDPKGGGDLETVTEHIKQVTLGSRKNLCINPKVAKLGNATAINERCSDLQQPSTPEDKRCEFLPTKDNMTLLHDFRDHTLARIRDIEDLGHLGKRLGICPYYASRAAVKPSEVVTLPYPLLLQKSAREALGISLRGHVVIIDEAHNLMDAISNVHSVSISKSQLADARAKIGKYLEKFRNRLKGKNRMYITHLVRVVDSLLAYLHEKGKAPGVLDGIVSTGDLLAGKAVDQVNLYKLMHYLNESRLARKVDGYNDSIVDRVESVKSSSSSKPLIMESSSSVPVLHHVQAFLLALTYPAAEGRFFYDRGSDQDGQKRSETLRYLLLDPLHHFKDIVDEARAVILAGGTMSPMSDYTDQLFRYLPSSRIQTLSCGHVIPASNLIAMPVSHGPDGTQFDFTFDKRGSDATLVGLGRALIAIASDVPDGLVVFFPSYSYLATCVSRWQSRPPPGSSRTLWDDLRSQKPIFQETASITSQSVPSSGSNSGTTHGAQPTNPPKYRSTDELLTAYTSSILAPQNKNTRGALLLAVIGGSLSEGINFADRLGRCIVVVGLPFPNAKSPELKSKLEFVERRHLNSGSAAGAGAGAAAAKEYYTNICMRAVNQSIGRAIRHRDDYAAIMLLDRRYSRSEIHSKLPGWIRNSLVVVADDGNGNGSGERFEGQVQNLRRFFRDKGGRVNCE